MKQVITGDFLSLVGRKKDYNRAIKLLCNTLPRKKKALYRVIIKDLIYHFEPTKVAPCRARVERDGTMWTVDSYETIAERMTKALKQPFSAKTVQRYHKDLADKGYVRTERHMFAGKNTLHRAINADRLGFDLATLLITEMVKEMKQASEEANKRKNKERESKKTLGELIKEAAAISRDGPSTDNRTTDEISEEVEAVIRTGDLLFGLGLLTEKRKKKTQEARTRILQLVEGHLLSVDVLHALKDAWEAGAFEDLPEVMETPRLWPNWLNIFYPRKRAICQGLAALFFLEMEPTDCPWLIGNSLSRYLRCQKYTVPAFEQLQERQCKDPQPADYCAINDVGGIDLTLSQVYYQRLFPGADPNLMELPKD